MIVLGFFLALTCYHPATNDQEYAVLERRFNEFQKVVERLEKDAEAFRDAVAGKRKEKKTLGNWVHCLFLSFPPGYNHCY